MDRSLDEVISERQMSMLSLIREGTRVVTKIVDRAIGRVMAFSYLILLVPPSVVSGTASPSRVKYSADLPSVFYDTECSYTRNESSNIDRDWVHDKFEDDRDASQSYRGPRNRTIDRYSPEAEAPRSGAKLRVENLHYDLTEEDLEDLFTRIGPILSLSLRYDRAGRSDGTAFVTYEFLSDARLAIREFDGANAKGQPIRLTLMPTAPSRTVGRNPFDTAQKPGRSLFERIEAPKARARSASPGRPRATDTSKPPPEGIDRYVPGQRSRSPARRRGGDGRGNGGRRPGARREESGHGRGQGRGRGDGRMTANGRPRKTQEELDAEMEDYWGGNKDGEGTSGQVTAGALQNGSAGANAVADVPDAMVDDGDIEMIE